MKILLYLMLMTSSILAGETPLGRNELAKYITHIGIIGLETGNESSEILKMLTDSSISIDGKSATDFVTKELRGLIPPRLSGTRAHGFYYDDENVDYVIQQIKSDYDNMDLSSHAKNLKELVKTNLPNSSKSESVIWVWRLGDREAKLAILTMFDNTGKIIVIGKL